MLIFNLVATLEKKSGLVLLFQMLHFLSQHPSLVDLAFVVIGWGRVERAVIFDPVVRRSSPTIGNYFFLSKFIFQLQRKDGLEIETAASLTCSIHFTDPTLGWGRVGGQLAICLLVLYFKISQQQCHQFQVKRLS